MSWHVDVPFESACRCAFRHYSSPEVDRITGSWPKYPKTAFFGTWAGADLTILTDGHEMPWRGDILGIFTVFAKFASGSWPNLAEMPKVMIFQNMSLITKYSVPLQIFFFWGGGGGSKHEHDYEIFNTPSNRGRGGGWGLFVYRKCFFVFNIWIVYRK